MIFNRKVNGASLKIIATTTLEWVTGSEGVKCNLAFYIKFVVSNRINR